MNEKIFFIQAPIVLSAKEFLFNDSETYRFVTSTNRMDIEVSPSLNSTYGHNQNKMFDNTVIFLVGID